MKPASTPTTLLLANAPADSRKILAKHRAMITTAQAKLAPLLKRRSDLDAKRDSLLDQLGEPDPLDVNAIEQHAAGKRQLALLENSILELDPQVAAGERVLRLNLIDARNLACRPILEPECPTIFDLVVKGVRPWCHSDTEAESFARQLPVLGDFQIWCGLAWVETAPLEQAATRLLSILDTLSRSENPFHFENGL